MGFPKVVILYNGLNAGEKARFREFVASPFFNKREKLKKLFGFIEKTSAGESWDREKAYQYIFGNIALNELQLNNLLSDLYKLGEKFLVNLQLDADRDLKDVALIESFVNKGSRHDAEGFLNKKKREKINPGFYSGYKLNLLADQFHFRKSRKTDNTFLIASQHQLDLFFVCTQLKIWCELLNRSQVLSLGYDAASLKRFEALLKSYLPEYSDHPYVSLYYPLFRWMKNPDHDTWYAGYLEKMVKYIPSLPKEEAKEICNYIQNYCVKRINAGKNHFLTELFSLFKIMLQHDLAYEGNAMPEWTYKNIVTVGVRLKEFVWTEKFIHDYYQMLAEAERDNAYQFNLAVLHYESGHPDRAMQLLNKVHFTDPNYYLDSKSILLKIYFEQEEDTAIASLRDTVKVYLLREKLLNKTQKLLYRNLFSYTLKLYKLKYESAHLKKEEAGKAVKSLFTQIEANPLVANKQWLLNMRDE